MMKRTFGVALSAASLICALVACSSAVPIAAPPRSSAAVPIGLHNSAAIPPTAAAQPAAGSTCALVTLPEVSTATGTTMKVTADDGALGECIFSAVKDPSNVLYLSVDSSSDDIDQRKAQLESLSTHLSGMGDDAFWNSTLGEVFVQKGGRALIVIQPSLANITATPAANQARMVALATAALGRW